VASPSRRPLPPAARGALIGAAGALVGLALLLSGALESFEARTWDWREKLFARPGRATPGIALILLDQKSLDWGKEESGLSWPWPRETYAAVADFCTRAGARALVFDVLYTEPSSYGVADDEALASAAAGNGRAVGAVFASATEGSAADWPPEAPGRPLEVAGLAEWRARARPRHLEFPRAAFPIPALLKGFAAVGNTNLRADPDGVYRRGALFGTFGGRVMPSQALAVYLAGNPGDHAISIRPGLLSVDGMRVPVDRDGQAILRFRGGTRTHPSFSAAAVIQSEVQLREGSAPNIDPKLLQDRYVFFGFSAPGLFDLRAAPTQGLYPGVEVNATMLDDLLSGDFLRTAPLLLTLLVLLALCAGSGAAVSAVSGAGRNALIYLAFVPAAPALALGAYAAGMWLPLMALEIGTLVSLVGASLASYATEGQQKRFLKSAFRQYLSPAVIEELISHPDKLQLGGERRELSMYFSDLQGFTSISELLAPAELTVLLNEYLSAMADIVMEEGGTIDKYEGDAIIAFWNAPVAQEDHALRAVRAALRCQERLSGMRPALRERYGKDLFMRIGLNTGPAAVGNFGSRTRFDYTMLGDQVNLAARLEGVNKQFRTYTLASAATLARAGAAFPSRELGRIAVVGRKEPVTVHEPMLAETHSARAAALAVFSRGLAGFYAGRFEEAARIFAETAQVDPPAAAYVEKCRDLLSHPPAAPWEGVWIMTSK
jgi:adenylate cyclase